MPIEEQLNKNIDTIQKIMNDMKKPFQELMAKIGPLEFDISRVPGMMSREKIVLLDIGNDAAPEVSCNYDWNGGGHNNIELDMLDGEGDNDPWSVLSITKDGQIFAVSSTGGMTTSMYIDEVEMHTNQVKIIERCLVMHHGLKNIKKKFEYLETCGVEELPPLVAHEDYNFTGYQDIIKARLKGV